MLKHPLVIILIGVAMMFLGVLGILANMAITLPRYTQLLTLACILLSVNMMYIPVIVVEKKGAKIPYLIFLFCANSGIYFAMGIIFL